MSTAMATLCAEAAGFTAVITVAASPAAVFRELADIERLPRWAGGFCERVGLARGRWVALTSLGELFLALDADERAGVITLRAGWNERELHALSFQIVAGGADDGAEAPAAETRVIFSASRVTDPGHARLCRALGGEWPNLAARWEGGAAGRPGR